VGLVAVLALAGAACSGSSLDEGAETQQAGSLRAPPSQAAAGPDDPASPSTTPSGFDTGPTCASAVEELQALVAPADDLPGLLRAGGRTAEDLSATVAEAYVVVDEAAAQAAVAGQEEAQANLVVLTEMLNEVGSGLVTPPPLAIEAFTPPYFEHGYAAAALRDLAATANLGPCGEVADLVVGADG